MKPGRKTWTLEQAKRHLRREGWVSRRRYWSDVCLSETEFLEARDARVRELTDARAEDKSYISQLCQDIRQLRAAYAERSGDYQRGYDDGHRTGFLKGEMKWEAERVARENAHRGEGI